MACATMCSSMKLRAAAAPRPSGLRASAAAASAHTGAQRRRCIPDTAAVSGRSCAPGRARRGATLPLRRRSCAAGGRGRRQAAAGAHGTRTAWSAQQSLQRVPRPRRRGASAARRHGGGGARAGRGCAGGAERRSSPSRRPGGPAEPARDLTPPERGYREARPHAARRRRTSAERRCFAAKPVQMPSCSPSPSACKAARDAMRILSAW